MYICVHRCKVMESNNLNRFIQKAESELLTQAGAKILQVNMCILTFRACFQPETSPKSKNMANTTEQVQAPVNRMDT